MKFSLHSMSRLALGILGFVFAAICVQAQTALPAGRVGVAYTVTFTSGTSLPAGTVFSATGLPAGLGINGSSGTIAGTPSAAGNFNLTVSVAVNGVTNNYPYTLLVNPPTGTPTITSAATASGTAGTAFTTYTVTADNSPTSFNVGSLPAGLVLGGTATAPTISGTPTTAGTYTVSLSANNGTGTGAAKTLTITIAPSASAPAITNSVLAVNAPLGTAFSGYQITASNTPTSYAAAGLPVGLTLNSTSGAISGTATAAGIYAVSLSAANGSGTGGAVTLTITVGNLPTVANSTVTGGVGAAVSFGLASVTTNSPTSYNLVSGTLPAGLSLNASTGVISGTPSATSSAAITVSANNTVGTGSAGTITFNIGALPVVANQSLTGTAGTVFSFSLSSITTNTATSWAITGGTLPTGLTLNSLTGVISGTPATASTGTVVVAASNTFGTGPVATLSFTISAAPSGGGGGGGIGGGGGGIVAPAITAQPAGASVFAGESVTFSVTATGTTPNYQWLKDGNAISGAVSSSYTITSVTAADAATYSVRVTNLVGSATSNGATLIVLTPTAVTPPSITTQPTAQTATEGGGANFTVAASGTAPLTYQWRKGGTAISGATSATLALSGVTAASAGSYSVVVSNSAGSATSNSVTLTVNPATPPPRGFAGAYFGTFGGGGGTFALFIRSNNTGVFLGYAKASKVALISRDIVVDGDGRFSVAIPQAFATATPAADGTPAIVAHEGEYHIEGGIAANGALTGTVSALNLTMTAPAGATTGATADIAGFYQAGAAGSSATGYVIVGAAGEAFALTTQGTAVDAGKGTIDATGKLDITTDANARVTGSVTAATAVLSATLTTATGAAVTFVGANDDARTNTEKLINISTRSQAGGASGVLIAGFVITGDQPKQVLVRAVGPTLTTFGLTGVQATPRLEVFRGSTSIGVSNEWGANSNAAAIAATATRVGAFALATGSKDAALLLTLEPGAYTAIVSGAASGVALVEAYDATEGKIARSQRVVNLSTRALAGSAENTLIAGFVVSGTVPKRVLIRGVGPGLAQFGLTNGLARPQITVYGSNNAIVAQNAGWGTSADAAAIAAASEKAGAFALAAGSQDAALILNLQPGAYTAQVTAATGANTAGVALVEVYELP